MIGFQELGAWGGRRVHSADRPVGMMGSQIEYSVLLLGLSLAHLKPAAALGEP